MPVSLPANKDFVTIGQAAKLLNVHIKTLRRWDQAGKISTVRLDGKNRYFSLSQLKKLKEEKPLSISQAAEKLNVSVSTLRRMDKRGDLKAERNELGERIYHPKIDKYASKPISTRPATPFQKAFRPMPKNPIYADAYAWTKQKSFTSNPTPTGYQHPTINTIMKNAYASQGLFKAVPKRSQEESTPLYAPTPTTSANSIKSYPKISVVNFITSKTVITFLLFLLITPVATLGFIRNGQIQTNQFEQEMLRKSVLGSKLTQDVLAATTSSESGRFVVNIPTQINQSASVSGTLTAPNILYSVIAGNGISVGPGQNPTITNTGVLSVGGQTGAVTLTGGTGIDISGTTISMTSTGVTSLNTLNGALKIAGGGINSVGASGTTITVTGTEADTLATVTGRGATTTTALTLSNTGNLISVGTLTFGTLTSNGGVLYTNGSGVTMQATAGSSGQCLLGGTTPSFGNCNSGSSDTFWDQTNGLLYPNNSTVDFAIGGQASSSAKFAVLNVNSGTPTASVSAGTAGAAYLTAAGKLASTALQPMTIGDSSTTGEVIINPVGNVGIGSTNPGTKLDITGTLRASGAITFSTFSTAGGLLYTNGSGLLTQLTSQGNSGQCLLSNGSGAATSFGNCNSGTADAFWNQTAGALHTNNSTVDLLVGGQASTSAKFAVLNVAVGTPTASVSAGTAGGTYLTATGNLATTAMQTLTLGGTTTGAIALSPASATPSMFITNGGNVGIGTTNPTTKLFVTDNSSSGSLSITTVSRTTSGHTVNFYTSIDATSSNPKVTFESSATTVSPDYYFQPSTGTTMLFLQSSTQFVGIGTTTPLAKLDVAGSASASGNLSLRGAATAHTFNILDNGTLNFQRSPGGDAGLATALYIDNAGRVDVGGTNPGGNTSGNGYAYSTDAGAPTLFQVGDVSSAGDVRMVVAAQGYAGRKTYLTLASGDGAFLRPAVNLHFDPTVWDNGLGLTGTTYLDILQNGAALTNGFHIRGQNSSTGTFTNLMSVVGGNVGIGTTVPGAKLDVAGTASTDDTIQVAPATGGAGRFSGAITSADLTASGNWSFPNAYGTICISGQTCASSGTVGYWSRTSTTLSPATANDIISVTSNDTSTALLTLAPTGVTGTGLAVSALSGTTANTGINIGAISGTGATGTGITIGNISSTGSTNYGLQLGTMTGGTSSNYQIATGAITSATTTNNAQINLAGIVTTGGTNNYGINIGALSGTGATNYGINITASTAIGTTNYGLNVGNITGAASGNNYGIYIGTVSGANTNTAANNFALYSSSTSYSYFGGNVGIGTTNPVAPLDIGADTNTVIGGLRFTNVNNTATGAKTIEWRNTQNAGYYATRIYADIGSLGVDPRLYFQLNDRTTGPGWTDVMTIRGGSSNSVGIGSTSPTATLDVVGSASLSANLSFRGAGTAHEINYYDNGTLNFQRSPGGDAGETSVLYLGSNGNIGIGTTGPGAALDVFNAGERIGAFHASDPGVNPGAGQLTVGLGGGNGSETTATRITLVNGHPNSPTLENANTIDFATGTNYNASSVKARISGGGYTNNTSGFLGFYTMNSSSTTEKMRLDNNGNLGIGTTGPTSLLYAERNGNDFGANITVRNTTSGTTAGAALAVGSNGSTEFTYLYTISPGYTSGNQYQADSGLLEAESGLSAGLGLSTRADAPIRFYTNSGNERMMIAGGGNVGIGTTNPTQSQLVVYKSTSTAAATIDLVNNGGNHFNFVNYGGSYVGNNTFGVAAANTAEVYSSTAMYMGTGTAAPIAFFTNASTTPNLHLASGGNVGIGSTTTSQTLDVAGGIQGNFADSASTTTLCASSNATTNTDIVQCNGVDYAEYTPSIGDVEKGDLLALSPIKPSSDKPYAVERASHQSDILYGIYSTAGTIIGKQVDQSYIPVALAGRLPLKVSLENGPIKKGDLLTLSSIPGVAAKATKAGQVVGTAMEDYDGTEQLSDGTKQQEKALRDYKGEVVPTPPTGIGKIIVFVNVSFADPKNVLANLSIDVNGNVFIPGLVTNSLTVNGPLDVKTSAVSIPPSSDLSNLQTSLSQLTSHNNTLDTITASLSARVAFLEQIASNATAATSNGVLGASTAAQLTTNLELLTANMATISGTLNVTGRTTVADLGVTGNIIAGVMSIHGLDGEINTLAGDLKLQSNGINGIDLIAGKVTIDTSGNIKTEGTITAKKVNIDTTEVLSASVGTGTLPSGDTQVAISTTAVTANSKIFVTATKKTGNQPLIVSQKNTGSGFVVSIENSYSSDIKFDWWIVN